MSTTQAMQRANQQIAEIKRRLEIKKEEISFLVQDDQATAKLMMGALMAAADDAKIRECEPNSVVRAVIQAALCGAEIAAGLGEGYLVPYRNKELGVKECQFMPGYRLGQRNIQQASGLRVIADVVYTNDHWRYTQVPLVVEHTPAMRDRGERILSYAVALNEAGRVMFCQLASAEDIETAKRASRKGRDTDSPAWRNWEDRMWRKVAIMRLAKEVRAWKPSAKLDETLKADAHAFNGTTPALDNLPTPRVLPPAEPVEGTHKLGTGTIQEPPQEEPEPEPVKSKPEPKPDPDPEGQWDNVGPPPMEPPSEDEPQGGLGW